MHPASRIIVAILAVFVLWTVVRALRRGVDYSRGYSFSLEDSPMLFILAVSVHGLIAVFFAYLAAGYEMIGLVRLFARQ